MSAIVLLGPQRSRPILGAVADSLGIDGPVAVITAGWLERENEDTELADALGRPIVNLHLHQRAEQAYEDDAELLAAEHARRDHFKQLRELYNLRLAGELSCARTLLKRDGDPDLLEPEREATLNAIRAIDTHHLRRIRLAREQFNVSCNLPSRPSIVKHRSEIAQLIGACDALAIAGGHVAILLDLLRLFDIGPLFDVKKPLLAWSAGAMAISQAVVLFHDSPPQGFGNPEILDAGLGIARGVLPLPHARRRLDLNDRIRVSLLSRRFSPLTCAALHEGSILPMNGAANGTAIITNVDRLTDSGRVIAFDHPEKTEGSHPS